VTCSPAGVSSRASTTGRSCRTLRSVTGPDSGPWVVGGSTVADVAEWLTIEVLDAGSEGSAFPASLWQHAHGNDLVEAAVTHGALYWEWQETRSGVVLELVFADDEALERYRGLPAVVASLDAVPDRVSGLLVYRGRGGGAGASVPRRPRPKPVAGSAEWPAPEEFRFLAVEHATVELADDAEHRAC
jgi:hypothetical protein